MTLMTHFTAAVEAESRMESLEMTYRFKKPDIFLNTSCFKSMVKSDFRYSYWSRSASLKHTEMKTEEEKSSTEVRTVVMLTHNTHTSGVTAC